MTLRAVRGGQTLSGGRVAELLAKTDGKIVRRSSALHAIERTDMGRSLQLANIYTRRAVLGSR